MGLACGFRGGELMRPIVLFISNRPKLGSLPMIDLCCCSQHNNSHVIELCLLRYIIQAIHHVRVD